jgi:hypothetical protein
MTTVNGSLGRKRNFYTHVQDGQDENCRERLKLNADAKDEIQISHVGETFVEYKSVSLLEKSLRRQKRSLFLEVIGTFFYFQKCKKR